MNAEDTTLPEEILRIIEFALIIYAAGGHPAFS